MKRPFRIGLALCIAFVFVLGAVGPSVAQSLAPPGDVQPDASAHATGTQTRSMASTSSLGVFEEVFSIPTNDAYDWEFFTIGSDAYLAVANAQDGNWNFDIASKIYRWNGASFVEFQSIIGYAAGEWEFFIIGSDAYLALVNGRGADSTIYRWDGTRFVEFQTIPIQTI